MIREKLIFKIEAGLIPFLPTDLDGLVFWADPTNNDYINSLLAADFGGSGQSMTSNIAGTTPTTGGQFHGGFWFRADTVGSSRTIIGRWNTTAGNKAWRVLITGGKLQLEYSSNGSTTAGSILEPTVLSNSVWYFCDFYLDSANSEMGIAINNNTHSVTTFTGTMQNPAEIRAGRASGTLGGSYNGRIDALFFASQVLSTAERDAFYNSGNGVDYNKLDSSFKTNLLAWFKLNEPSSTRYDSHGSNTFGTSNVFSNIGKIQEESDEGRVIYTAIDRSLFLNNAIQTTITKQPTWQANRAIEFDGSNDAMDVFSIWNDLSSASGFSFSFWIKPDQVAAGKSILNFYRPNGGTHEYNRISVNQSSSGKLSFYVTVDNSTLISTYVAYETLNTVLTLGTWNFLTVNYAADGTAPKFYLDGVEVPSNDLGSADLTKGVSDLNAMLGASLGSIFGSGGAERSFYDGQIGQVFLTKEAITDNEVTELYNYSSPNY